MYHDRSGEGEPEYVDRSAQGQALAQRVHSLMSRLRYSGTLRVKVVLRRYIRSCGSR